MYIAAEKNPQSSTNKDTQMIQAIKNVVANSIILVFSPTKLAELVNYG